MQHQNDGGTRVAEPEEGKIIEAIFAHRRPIPVSDVRLDALIDVGVLLGAGDLVMDDQSSLMVSRAKSVDYTLYTVHEAGCVVFDVMYPTDGTGELVYGEFLDGAWRLRLAQLAALVTRVTAC
jgi:hypothetical protein